MKKTKISVLFLAVLILLPLLTVTARANSAPPSPNWYFLLKNRPYRTVYMDLLIRLPEEDPNYTPLNEGNIPTGFAPDAGILTYRDGEYCSYTFHYRDAVSNIELSEYGYVFYFDNLASYSYSDEIAARGKIRLALLDEKGNIIQVSEELDVNEQPRGFMEYVTGGFTYDAKTGTLEINTSVSSYGVAMYLFLCFLGMGLTCWMEYLVAIPFRLRRDWGELILLTNAVSQILMHLSYILLYRYVFWRYAYATIVLEVLVFAGEFLFYRWKMKDVSRIRCLLYTVAANAFSLAHGLWLMNSIRE